MTLESSQATRTPRDAGTTAVVQLSRRTARRPACQTRCRAQDQAKSTQHKLLKKNHLEDASRERFRRVAKVKMQPVSSFNSTGDRRGKLPREAAARALTA